MPKTISWYDRTNNNPSFFYYVAIGSNYESDCDEKYFLNKDKAEEYARWLYEDWKDEIEDPECSCHLITHMIAFDD